MQDLKKETKKSLTIWKPNKGENYWCMTAKGRINCVVWDDDNSDKDLYKIGNCFKTEEEIKFEVERLKVIAELKRFGKDKFKKDTINYYLFCSISDNKLCIAVGSHAITADIFFDSKEIAEQAIKAVGVDRIKKYYFRVEE